MATFAAASSPAKKKKGSFSWVALVTEYPTTYGCNRGRTYFTEGLWGDSDTDVHKCSTEAAALA